MNHFKKCLAFLMVAASGFSLCSCMEEKADPNAVESGIISISDELVLANETGTEQTLTVTASKPWTLSFQTLGEQPAPDWVRVDVQAGEAGETAVKVTVDPTTQDKPRAATLVFTADEGHQAIVNINQEKFRISHIEMSGVVPTAVEPLHCAFKIYYSGFLGKDPQKIQFAAENGRIEFTTSEYEEVFPFGEGCVTVWPEGTALSRGDEAVKVTIGPSTLACNLKVAGFWKIKDFMETYPSFGDVAPAHFQQVEIKEDVMLEGFIVSNTVTPAGARKGSRALTNDQIVLQDAKDPHSAVWFKAQTGKFHNFPMGSRIQVNLKGMMIGFDSYGRKFIRSYSGFTNDQIVFVDKENLDRYQSVVPEFTVDEFMAKHMDYEQMMVKVNNVRITDDGMAKVFNPAGKTEYNYVPVESASGKFVIATFKLAPWRDMKPTLQDLPYLQGLSWGPSFDAHKGEAWILPQQIEHIGGMTLQ